MKFRKLGTTGLDVSLICLGTMTWGSQNDEAEAHAQMDYAVERGVNFFDTAELYAIPPTEETQGLTEKHIGTWFEKSGKRDDIILASKVVGPAGHLPWFKRSGAAFSKENVQVALEASLKRLNTDYIDLYQLHWPDRGVNTFGTLDYKEGMYTPEAEDQILETLRVLDEQIKAGKIRYIGLSNESPWGVMKFLNLAEKHNLPRMQSVQNAYNLLNRKYEIGTAEVSMYENCGLLAYSPLARGRLSGKYLGGQVPEGSAKSIDSRPSRWDKPRSLSATQEYVAIAEKHGIDPSQMALAFVNARAFVTSNIIGATNLDQLKVNIDSVDVELSDEVIAEINAVHLSNPTPSEQ